MKNLLPIVLLIFCGFSSAETANDGNYLPTGEWQVSLAFGYGEIGNPVAGGDDRPMYIAPSFRYYGQQLFLDNGLLGYTVAERNNVAISVTTSLNKNARYFQRWHPDNWLISAPNFGMSSVAPAENQDWVLSQAVPKSDQLLPPLTSEGDIGLSPQLRTSLEDLAERKWSFDAGLQINWFFSNKSQLIINLNSDLLGVHDGQNVRLEWSNGFTFGTTRWSYSLGGVWQSSKLNSYYYGLSPRDNLTDAFSQTVSSGWSPFVSVAGQYPIDQHWHIFWSMSQQKLSSALQDSILITESKQRSYFAGVKYAF